MNWGFPFYGFRRTIVLAFGLLVSLSMAGMVYLEMAGFPGSVNQGKISRRFSETIGDMELVSDLFSQRISAWTLETRSDLAYLAVSPLFRGAVEKGSVGHAFGVGDELAAFLTKHHDFSSMSLYDPEKGTLIAGIGEDDPVNMLEMAAADKKRLGQLALPGYVESLGLYRQPDGGTILQISHQIPSVSHPEQIAGLLVANCKLETVMEKLLWGVGTEIDRDWDVLIAFRVDGTVYQLTKSALSAEKGIHFQAVTAIFQPIAMALDGVEGPYDGPDQAGQPIIAYHRQIRIDAGISLVLLLSTHQVLVIGPVLDDLRRRVILWGILLGGVVGLSILVANQISRPVKVLLATARRIESGDLEARAVITQKSELGQFAQVFNGMADRILSWSVEMERRVAERTAELRALSLRQEAILSAVPDIVMEVNTKRVYTWANQAGLEFFGPGVIGHTASDFFTGEQDTYERVNPLFAGATHPVYVESWQQRSDGESRLLAWWCKLLADDQGKVIGTLSTARDITEQRRDLERTNQALREKETLIQEIYHRTKNTLQVIQGMLELQAAEHPDMLEYQNLVRDTGQRIQAIALVHQMLYRSSNLSRVSIAAYLTELTQLILGLAVSADGLIRLDILIEDSSFSLDTIIPLGLIINELMSNSLKYAFIPGQPGHIRIRLEADAATGFRLSYADDGRGCPPDFDFRNQPSLGMRLIFSLGEEQLQGRVTMSGQGGVSFRLDFYPSAEESRI